MKKKIFLILNMILFGFAFLHSQTLVSTSIEKKNAILEEYTGIHCQYCPEGHAIGQALYDANPYDVVLINIHTGGYAVPNSGEPDYRTAYGDGIAAEASISGYPAGSVNRHIFSDLSSTGGTSMSRGSWETAAGRILAENSPVNVGASTSYNSSTRELTVNVELYYTADAPTSSNFINVALVQNHIIGPQQDGGTWVTNYEHNHMLRDMITGQWGEEITTTTQSTFVQKTYTYTVPDNFNSIPCIVNDCDIAVFISKDHKEIYSGVQIPAINGTTYIIGTFSEPTEVIQSGSNGNISTFAFDFTNGFSSNENFTFTLTKDNEPNDWSSSFTINGNTYGTTGMENITGNVSENISVDITPGISAGFSKYTLTAESVNNPNLQSKKIELYVIANTGTLLVHNAGSWSTGNPSDFENSYFSGFDYANVTDYASCSYNMFIIAAGNNKIGAIHTIFYNVAWTFPGINEDLTAILTPFLDNGGNLFIAGQDLGWDTWQNSGTDITKSFYTNYLNASFQADGSGSNNSIYPNPDDGVFGDLNSSSLINVYGGSNMYPDELTAVGYGSVFLYYLNNTSKGAAVKSSNGNYKVVYLGFDPPMISDDAVKNEIIKRSIDWFNDILAPNASFNPIDGSTNISVSTTVTITFDQGVRMTDNSEITNADIINLVTFEDSDNNAVTYSGNINSEKTQILITPDADLNYNTEYTVSVSGFESNNDIAGNAGSVSFTTKNNTGINEFKNVGINIFPNPAKNYINIKSDDFYQITISDISGKIIYSDNLKTNERNINISNLSNGIYIVKFISADKIITKKFTVNR